MELATSYSPSISRGMSVSAIMRDASLRRMTIALVPVAISVSFCTLRGSSTFCKPSTTTAAAAAVFSRSSSQRMRMVATDGAKISTSASMTKTIVSRSSLPERPRKNPALVFSGSLAVAGRVSSAMPYKLPCPSTKTPESPHTCPSQSASRQGSIIGDGRLFSNLGAAGRGAT
ncbi:hypothetical protein D9M72_451690 [compost metagenome]